VGKEDRVFCHALCSKTIRFAHKWNAGMLEYWNNGFEEFFDNQNIFIQLFSPMFHFSNIPILHVVGINWLPSKAL
jgi:hypothetical protein